MEQLSQVARRVTALVPLSLFDTTVLDAILARLVAIDLPALTERDLHEMTGLVEAGWMDEPEAIAAAGRILRANALELFPACRRAG